MATKYVGVAKNSAGTGWIYSVLKPGNTGPSYLRKQVFKTAKEAAVVPEAKIILQKI